MAAHKEFNMGAEFADLDFHSIRLEQRFISVQIEDTYRFPPVPRESARVLSR
jgi:hypothetical protein